MSPDSEFRRIVLIKSISDKNHNIKIFKQKGLVEHTHIQSYNGIFLDGMDISEATRIFHSQQRSPVAHLMIRYIHPLSSTQIPAQQPDSPSKPKAPTLNPLSEECLPIPLYILGDNYLCCKKLFDLLKEGSSCSIMLSVMHVCIINYIVSNYQLQFSTHPDSTVAIPTRPVDSRSIDSGITSSSLVDTDSHGW